MYQFLDELKVIGEAMKDITNLKQMNDIIRNKCQEFLINIKRAPALNSIIIVSCLKSILQSCGLEVASISFFHCFPYIQPIILYNWLSF
jgi:hypothetical protein